MKDLTQFGATVYTVRTEINSQICSKNNNVIMIISNQRCCRTTHVTANQTLIGTLHITVQHASRVYVNDDRVGGGLKVLDGASLNAWPPFLCNVSVWYPPVELSVTQESWRLRGREPLIRDRGRCSEADRHRVSTSLSSSGSYTHIFSNYIFITFHLITHCHNNHVTTRNNP